MYDSGSKILKILLIGDSGVGKSSHILRFTDCTFIASFLSTVGVDFKITTRDVGDQRVKFQIWDTAGQERFRTISSSYYKGTAAIVLVYDITDRHTFQTIKQGWMNEVRSHASPDVVLLLVGSKSDLKDHRVVTYDEGVELANSLGIPFMETSSKEDQNVTECFMNLAERCLRKTNP